MKGHCLENRSLTAARVTDHTAAKICFVQEFKCSGATPSVFPLDQVLFHFI